MPPVRPTTSFTGFARLRRALKAPPRRARRALMTSRRGRAGAYRRAASRPWSCQERALPLTLTRQGRPFSRRIGHASSHHRCAHGSLGAVEAVEVAIARHGDVDDSPQRYCRLGRLGIERSSAHRMNLLRSGAPAQRARCRRLHAVEVPSDDFSSVAPDDRGLRSCSRGFLHVGDEHVVLAL